MNNRSLCHYRNAAFDLLDAAECRTAKVKARSNIRCNSASIAALFAIPLLTANFLVDANPLVWNFEAGGTAVIGKPVPGLSCSGNCPVLSDEFARAGKSSLKTVVDRINIATSYRTEVQQGIDMDANRGEQTTDYWFGFSLYVPSPYPVLRNPTWEIFFQVHSTPPQGVSWDNYPALSPPLEMNLRPSSADVGTIRVLIRGLDTPYPQSMDSIRLIVDKDIATYTTNKWIDVVVHSRYDSGSAGFTQIWINGVLSLDYKGSSYYRGHGAPYPKFGLYNGWFTRILPNEPVTKRTVFHDEYRMAWGSAGSFAAVSPSGSDVIPIMAPVLRQEE